MALKSVHDTLEEIPEQYRELYVEKGEKWELTGIDGVFTQGDLHRIQTSLDAERKRTERLEEDLKVWEGWDQDDINTQLARIPELEIAAKGNVNDADIEEMVARRLAATIDSRTAPLEKQVKQLTTEVGDLKKEREILVGEKQTRRIHDSIRDAMVKQKVLPDAYDDVLRYADVFELRDDKDGLGEKVVTKDNVGVVPGMAPESWLTDIQERRPHWWPGSQGGGARGTQSQGPDLSGANPFAKDTWNLTAQLTMVRDEPEKAKAFAEQAGVPLNIPA